MECEKKLNRLPHFDSTENLFDIFHFDELPVRRYSFSFSDHDQHNIKHIHFILNLNFKMRHEYDQFPLELFHRIK